MLKRDEGSAEEYRKGISSFRVGGPEKVFLRR